MKKVIMAAHFAAGKHREQRRRDREASPYINHPLSLASVLVGVGVGDEDVIAGALLHDTIEDTDTRPLEIADLFGEKVMLMVMEVTDDKTLPKTVRKQLQIDHAPDLSYGAKLIKLGDKIVNLRDVAFSPPHDWTLARRQEYFDWAKAVVDAGLRSVHEDLEVLFDEAYGLKPQE